MVRRGEAFVGPLSGGGSAVCVRLGGGDRAPSSAARSALSACDAWASLARSVSSCAHAHEREGGGGLQSQRHCMRAWEGKDRTTKDVLRIFWLAGEGWDRQAVLHTGRLVGTGKLYCTRAGWLGQASCTGRLVGAKLTRAGTSYLRLGKGHGITSLRASSFNWAEGRAIHRSPYDCWSWTSAPSSTSRVASTDTARTGAMEEEGGGGRVAGGRRGGGI